MTEKKKTKSEMTDKERYVEAIGKIQASRPPGDKRRYRVRADRKRNVTRKPDGSLSMGGWRGHPNSLAALERNRAKGGLHKGANTKRCARPGCGDVAVRGADECRRHGGKYVLMARKGRDPLWRPKRNVAIKQQLWALLHENRVPRELFEQEVFRNTLDAALSSGKRDPDMTHEERTRLTKRWEASIRLALEMVGAWLELVDGHHVRWHDAVAKARDLGF